MINITAQKREIMGKKTKQLREKNILPGVLYGQGKSLLIEVANSEFKKVFKEAGENTLIDLHFEGKKIPVLIHDIQEDSLTDEIIHVDFYQPSLTEKTEVHIPLVFEGESIAVKDFSGTLVKNVDEILVKALPQDLPHEIKINIDSLKTFEDVILVKDIIVPNGVEILKDLEDAIVSVNPPEDIEKELEESIVEDIEGVEKVEDKEEKESEKK